MSKALKHSKTGKAAGPSGVPSEMIKATGDKGVEWLTNPCNYIIAEGRLHGTRPRGRPRTTWLKDLATQANISYKEAITIPRDRKKWRSVGNPRRTPDDGGDGRIPVDWKSRTLVQPFKEMETECGSFSSWNSL